MIDFPSPILSVSPEVVKDLDGEDALYRMWAVFTKCKQSLKDGRRLENMSWRLWYREMSLSHSPESPTSGTSSPALSDAGCPSPLTPVSEGGPQDDFFAISDDSSESLLSVPQKPSRHSWHGGGVPPPPSNICRLSTANMPARTGTRSHHQQRVGTILMDVLPENVIVPSPMTLRRLIGHASRKPSVHTLNPGMAKPSLVQVSAASTLVNSHMLKPAFIPGFVAQPRPTITLPMIQLPSTPPMLAASRAVGVNPTPHPTPPATPHPSNSTGAVGLPPATTTHPSPPPVRPGFSVSKAVPAVTTLPSASSSTLAPVIANQVKSTAPPCAEAPVEVVSQVRADEMLKPSDRRLFLQSLEPPGNAFPSLKRREVEPPKSSDLPEPSPASTTSSNIKSIKSNNAPAPPKRTFSKPTIRRGKEISRFTSAKSTARQRPMITRKHAETKKPTFNVGSASSNGMKAYGHGQQMQRAPSVPQIPQVVQERAKPLSPTKKKGMAISTSSGYTTYSDDDPDWASEGNSIEDKDKEQEKKASKLREAAEEARRQRDMFSKLPKRSYTDLTKRTNSGLLSQLMNPDPSIFPVNHPYRQTHSTIDMPQFARQHGGHLPLPNYQTSRSSAAVPLAAQITPMNAQALSTNGAGGINNAYRPKGRPQGEELETDTEEEGTDNGIQLSTSLAQQKLAALAGPSRRRASERVNAPSGLTRTRAAHERGAEVPTAPIPLSHPYNLPPPAPPMTPRTTRRQMLSTELSESLRRNLLWVRQLGKANLVGAARRGGALGQRVQPLTQAQNDQPVDEREKRRRAALARNRSWADDFHYAGW